MKEETAQHCDDEAAIAREFTVDLGDFCNDEYMSDFGEDATITVYLYKHAISGKPWCGGWVDFQFNSFSGTTTRVDDAFREIVSVKCTRGQTCVTIWTFDDTVVLLQMVAGDHY
jgi:hypothetical protein